ncbi:MAG: ABC transporter ATP-binding protein [Lachnospiraceae bacterium]|jgi:putative ABC transport system ATP-binding protein
MDAILKVNGLKKYYGKGETLVKALDGVDLEIERGRFTAVIGTSGSGKSTLLNMLGGLDTPTEGSIRVGGTELASLNSEQATIFRRKQIGFVFQNYNLIPVLSVWENIIFPITLDDRRPDRNFIMQVVRLLGLEKKLDSLPNNLSGGQQQRVAIARALASKPAIILADEPTGNLDTRTSDDVIGLLKMTGKEFNQTIVMITHNPEIAQMADRIVRLEDGRIVRLEDGRIVRTEDRHIARNEDGRIAAQ